MAGSKYREYMPYFKRREIGRLSRREKEDFNNRHHEQLSKLVKNIFYFYIFLNVFFLITLYTTSVEELIVASSIIRIPILGSEVSYRFFVASGAVIILAIFVYLSIRLEELDKINATRKVPYIFNSSKKPVRQLSNLIVYVLGPVTVLFFANKVYVFSDLDRFISLVFFFALFSLVLYKRRESPHVLFSFWIVLFIGLFVYSFSFPTPIRFTNQRVDLVGANLEGVHLEGYRLDNLLINHTKLPGSNISDSKISSSEFWGANFDHALIYNTKISQSIGDYAVFHKAILRDVELQALTLRQANFSSAILYNVSFKKSEEEFAKLAFNNLTRHVVLAGADFTEATFVGVSFNHADLTNANFAFADLETVSFDQAILSRTDFRGSINLTCEQIKQARVAKNLLLPSHLRKCV